MPQKAHVTSVEAIEAFRANLINYVSKARPTLEEVSADVLRARSWLQNDQRTYWEAQVRRRAKELEEAQQALFSANIANLREQTSVEQAAYHRARRAFNEAQDKLRTLKKWNREFDGSVGPLVKQMEKLHTILANDLTQAIVYLAEVVRTLDAYAGIQPSAALASPVETLKPADKEPETQS
jgi:cyclopropane fatty-acyl-phospholipid synthase-like methyltransferase